MAEMIFSTRTENDSFLTALNPLTKLTGLILFSFGITSKVMPVSVSFMAAIVIIALSIRVPFMKYLKKAPALVILSLFILITEWIVSKSARSAFHEAMKFMSLILASAVLLDSTDPYDLASSLGKLLSPIAGKYAWRFSSYVMLTLALLPLIFDASSAMMDARRSRLGSFMKHPVRNISDYMLTLMLDLIKSAEMYSDALAARLYDEDAERIAPSVHFRDILLIVLMAAGAVWTSIL